jgi:hypothetical protein
MSDLEENNEIINKQLDNLSEQRVSDDDIIKAYKQAEDMTLIPVLKLIYSTTKIDYSKDFKIKIPFSSNKSKDILTGEIEISKINNPNIKYKIYLDLVDRYYDLNEELIKNNILSNGVTTLIDETNEELKQQLIQIITYLTQSAKIVFDNLKNKYTEIIEYSINMDQNTTIYLDYENETRLGIKIKQN